MYLPNSNYHFFMKYSFNGRISYNFIYKIKDTFLSLINELFLFKWIVLLKWIVVTESFWQIFLIRISLAGTSSFRKSLLDRQMQLNRLHLNPVPASGLRRVCREKTISNLVNVNDNVFWQFSLGAEIGKSICFLFQFSFSIFHFPVYCHGKFSKL